jgi:SRSO17 transposase
MLANAGWRTISWRTGTKGKLDARFAAVRVRVAEGPPQRIRDKGQQHLPGEEVWPIGEYGTSGEKKYYLATLLAKAELRTLAATIKARWICEQAHQQLKEELTSKARPGRACTAMHPRLAEDTLLWGPAMRRFFVLTAVGLLLAAHGAVAGMTLYSSAGNRGRRLL